MNPERLAELRRQRDLIRAHLTWLEREIAAEQPPTTAAVSREAPIVPLPSGEPGIAPTPLAPVGSENLAPHYEPDGPSVAASTRRGCLSVAIGGLLLFLGVIAVVLFLRYGDRPLLFMDEDPPPAHPTTAPRK